MLTVKWQNLSGDWFDGEYPDPMAYVIYNWKCDSCNQTVQLWQNGKLVIEWKK